jgi:hypothetical protein
MPLAWDRAIAGGKPAAGKASRMLRSTCGAWVFFLWALQQNVFLKYFGVQDVSVLTQLGIYSFYWWVLLGLA